MTGRASGPRFGKEKSVMGTLEGAGDVLTGAVKGIGGAIAEELGQGGARVIVNYSRSKEAAEDLVQKLKEHGSRQAVAIQADVSDATQAARLIEETLHHFGRIDILVNNAGINLDRTMKKMTVEDWNTVIQVALTSFFYTAKAAPPYVPDEQS